MLGVHVESGLGEGRKLVADTGFPIGGANWSADASKILLCRSAIGLHGRSVESGGVGGRCNHNLRAMA